MTTANEGHIWKLGDHINTDLIFPGKYLYDEQEPKMLAEHALEPLILDFYKKISRGDFIVAGDNFGCGSSREQAVTSLKYAGVGAIIARSFSRIFFRNAITHGLPVINCPALIDNVQAGERLHLDFDQSLIIHNNEEYTYTPLGEYVTNILNSGGLIPYLRTMLSKKNK